MPDAPRPPARRPPAPAWRIAERRVALMSALQVVVTVAIALAVLASAGVVGARLVQAESRRDEAAGLVRDMAALRGDVHALHMVDVPPAARIALARALGARADDLSARATVLAPADRTGGARAVRAGVTTWSRTGGGDGLATAEDALDGWLAGTRDADGRAAVQSMGDLTVTVSGVLLALTLAAGAAGAMGWVLLNRARRRLGDAVRHALDEQSALSRTAAAVAAARDERTLLDGVAGEAASIVRARHALAVRFLPGGIGEVAGASPGGDVWGDTPIPLAGDGVVGLVQRTDAPAVLPRYGDAEGDPVAAQAARAGIRSAIAAPIHVDGAAWGAIACFSERPGGFDPDAPALLERFCQLAALGIADAAARRRLEAQAAADALTGLPNHRAFRERLDSEAERARRHGRTLALVLFDLDGFRKVNDALGHRGGDGVLRDLARLLEGSARTGDTVARIGGQEFAWLMPDCDSWGAWSAAERLRGRGARGPLGGLTGQTLSAGVCDLAAADGRAERLFELASGALYWAKQHGGDLCVRYSADVVVDLSAQERAQRLERARALDAVRLLAQAVDARDPSTQRHSERVAALAAELARELEWAPDRVALLFEAALVHDVGKIGLADALLLKDGPLTPEERTRMQAHSALGAQMVTDVLSPEQVAWVRGHHERWDGGGYPDGLTGAAIPDGARILIVADAFDAMTSARPYRPGRPFAAARDEVLACGGAQFPPEVVAAFERIWRSGRLEDVIGSAAGGA